MQQYILSKKNVITVISGLLIALGFFSHFVLENVGLSEWSLIIASVFGITPIAIQAFQAMKVKVISIDDKKRINLSIKKADDTAKKEQPCPRSSAPAPAFVREKRPPEPQSFDDMISKFMKESGDKLSDFKDNKRTRPRRK